ncbi:MAG TPA: universal stress protein, partial [Chloroflexota bacterium]|nr:universal stress protein [Chloroflexota bacterium]
MIERILVPLDLNRLSEAKIPIAEAQAAAFDAEIILLHVLPAEKPTPEGTSYAEAQARTYLGAIAARLRSEGIRARPLVRSGAPAETILAEAAAQRADLIVLGTNLRHGISRLLIGSVAEEVVAKAPCPVLLVRPNPVDAERVLPVRSFTDDAERAGPTAPRALGLRTVEVSRIIGSVGRAPELDANFRSLSHRREEEMRYKKIYDRMAAGKPLPPVVLYKLGYGYYVLDGNHRVAAAKQLGQLEIEALVTEFVALGDPEAQRVFAERRAFEQTTGLTRIGASRSGQYPRFEEMIRAYAQEHGVDDPRVAASRWETEVYRPAARQIHARRLTQHFPGERTADVFIRVAACRDAYFEQHGKLLDWEEAM